MLLTVEGVKSEARTTILVSQPIILTAYSFVALAAVIGSVVKLLLVAPGIGLPFISHCRGHGPLTVVKNVADDPCNTGVSTGCTRNRALLQSAPVVTARNCTSAIWKQ